MLFYLAYFFVQWEVEIASGNIGFIQILTVYERGSIVIQSSPVAFQPQVV